MEHQTFQKRLHAARDRAVSELLAAATPAGHWEGELSSSALSTATAACALSIAQRALGHSHHEARIVSGLQWLARHRNPDGGWGDTVLSVSNLSTTVLCWSAFGAVPGADGVYREVVQGAERWITRHAGSTRRPVLAPAVVRRYGKDRTFSAPILTMCALAGRLGQGAEAWRWIVQLPFELAACPHQWFAALRLPVVSYALPALIAIGQVRHYHLPTANPVTRWLRNLARDRTLRILREIQPAGGGFLEATPLTSFVVMSLAGSGQATHPVCEQGLTFLARSQRSDGSWPIDTNLATWLTTLSLNALKPAQFAGVASRLARWLLSQQYRVEHPYTHAPSGGWAWTDLAGGVPDADDTAGALLALRQLGAASPEARSAAAAGVRWLINLQNRDGGIPTFCRGWGALPFDRSSPDLTAHAIRAWLAWLPDLPAGQSGSVRAALTKAFGYLCRAQKAGGSWVPLWFGNQFAPNEENPVYGTSRVLCALTDERAHGLLPPEASQVLTRGVQWLLDAQTADGSWGGPPGIQPSVEETALAVEALAQTLGGQSPASEAWRPAAREALARGIGRLIQQVESGQWREPAPIGFYFAKLWYFERLYPLIFTVGALNRAAG